MTVKIDKDYSGNIKLEIHGVQIQSGMILNMRPALIRHIVELSAAIEAAAGKPVMEEQREKAIDERRAAFNLMERFDGIPADTDEGNSVLRWLGDSAVRLSDDDEKRLHHILMWYRNNQSEDTEEFSHINQIIDLIERKSQQ